MVVLDSRTFVPANRVRNFLWARLLSKEEKADRGRGEPDVLLTDVNGGTFYVSRRDIRKNFRYLKGAKISIAGWKQNNNYLLEMPANEPMFIAYYKRVGTQVSVGDKNFNIEAPSYVICLPSEDGTEPDISTAALITKRLFSKMFYVPMSEELQTLISNYKRKKNEKQSPRLPTKAVEKGTPTNQMPQAKQQPKVSDVANKENNLFDNIFTAPTKKPTVTEPAIQSRPQSVQPVKPTQQQKQVQTTQQQVKQPQPQQKQQQLETYNIVGKEVDATGKIVAYTLESNLTDEIVSATTGNIIRLCRDKQIHNACIKSNDKGKVYLQGVGIKLADLPILNRL